MKNECCENELFIMMIKKYNNKRKNICWIFMKYYYIEFVYFI